MLGTYPDDLFVVESALPNSFNEIDQAALAANIVWNTKNATWTSITGWRDLDHNFRIDFSDALDPAFVIDQDGQHEQFSQEFHGAGSAGNFDWNLGVFYMKETNDNVRRDEFNIPAAGLVFDMVSDVPNDTESTALFGQGAWHVNDKVTLTLGGRWTSEDKTLDIVAVLDLGGGLIVPFFDTADLEALGTDTDPTFEQFTPHVGFQYDFNDDHMFYATYTEGFKSGGWNSRATSAEDFILIESETAEAFEIGFKSEFMNNRLRLNGAYFYNTYKDFIITAINPATGFFVTINAAEAVIQGIELELSARATDRLNLYASLGTMDNEYKELGPTVAFPITNEVKRTPELSAQIGFNYRAPVGASSAVIVSADYSHQDEYYAGVDNAPVELSGQTDLVSAAISYEGGDGRWMVTAACENCTDEEFHTSALNFGIFGFATQFPGNRQVYWLKFKYSSN